MMKRLLAAAAALALSAGVAQAATITVSEFSKAGYVNALASLGPSVVREDFEDEDYAVGNVGNGTGDPGFKTKVGTFRTMGGTGSGGTVRDPDPDLDGTKLAIRTGHVYGRSSTTDLLAGLDDDPDDGVLDKFLDSNDTFGIRWNVDIGSMFTRLVFVLTDATDVGAKMTIKTDGAEDAVLFGLGEGNRRLVVVDFGSAVRFAEITFFNSNKRNGNGFPNDGFSIDDIAVSAVPLPAPALMLLAGLGGLAAFRRKRAAA